MGLDTYAVVPSAEEEEGYRTLTAAEKADFLGVNLCGGMLSTCGQGSFRGGVYDDLIERLTDISLYVEFIAPATVAEMVRKLAETNRAALFPDEREDFDDLVKFFQICRVSGYGLHGSW
jgi:hypothetical protein